MHTYHIRPRKEAMYISSKGHNVETIILHNKIYGNQTVRNTINGISVIHYIGRSKKISDWLETPLGSIIFKPYYLYLGLKFLYWLRQYLKSNPCDYLLCHNLISAIIGFWAKPKSTKIIFVMREIYENRKFSKISKLQWPMWRFLSAWMRRHADFIIYVVPYQYKSMSRADREKAIYIPNYADRKTFYESCKRKSKKLRINYIGGPRDPKALELLFRAARRNSAIQVTIHGRWSPPRLAAALAARYPEVIITGEYDYDSDSRGLYDQTDILYCAYDPSRLNGKASAPIKLYEAIITKTPVVICQEMEAARLVEEKNIGWVFNFNEPEALENLIDHICKNRNEILEKESSLAKIQYDYTWESVVGRLDQIFAKNQP